MSSDHSDFDDAPEKAFAGPPDRGPTTRSRTAPQDCVRSWPPFRRLPASTCTRTARARSSTSARPSRLNQRVRSYFQTGADRDPKTGAAGPPDRRFRLHRHRDRRRRPDPRGPAHQGIPAPVQHPPEGRQGVPVPADLPQRALPADRGGAPPRARRRPLLRPVHRRARHARDAEVRAPAPSRCGPAIWTCRSRPSTAPAWTGRSAAAARPASATTTRTATARKVGRLVRFLSGGEDEVLAELRRR